MKTSAALLVYRRRGSEIDVLLVHPSGTYNARAPWSLPKGEVEPGEDLEAAARRETLEETGVRVDGPVLPLGHVDYTRSRKRIHAFAAEAAIDAAPSCASWEVDRAEMVALARARELLHVDQHPFLDRLIALVSP